MSIANFTTSGLSLGENNTNMTYLYGLSDFFTLMFEDSAKTNLILEANAQGASEIYSRFLQLTSSISLEDIQNTTNSQIKLITIKSTDAVLGQVNTYKLSSTVIESKFIANRPFLPSTLYEQEVDYRLEVGSDGSTQIRFAKPIGNDGFSTRTLSDGVTTEYALWFVDAEIDERAISKVYGDILGVDPQNSTDAFHNFVYGLYYVYVHGPTLELMRKGLNLTLGIPLARGEEQVLEIRQYLETDQYIVVTDQNQYIIPYGLAPIVAEGEYISTGDEIAQWVEIKDYLNDGEWWVNLQIPQSVIPYIPAGQKDRYATAGSHFDQLMRNYLKKHTFLVNVKVDNFKNIQSFQQLSDIIKKAKPTYTQPIYVWSISTLEDEFTVDDEESFYQRVDPDRCENLNQPIDKMVRDTTAPLNRGCPQFMRNSVPYFAAKLFGIDSYSSSGLRYVDDVKVGTYVNSVYPYRTNTAYELAWFRAVLGRGARDWKGLRSDIGYNRTGANLADLSGTPAHVLNVPAGMRLVPLYITKQYDVASKCLAVSADVPPMSQWEFTILSPYTNSEAINDIAINVGTGNVTAQVLIDNFNTLFFRDVAVGYLSAIMPEMAFTTWAPATTDIKDGDYLMGIRISEDLVGMYWITSNFKVRAPFCGVVEEADTAKITYDMKITRNNNGITMPFYNSRGAQNTATYTDKYNSNVPMDRSGIVLTHAQEL